MSGDLVLVVRRTIRAPATRLFEAWTQPEHRLVYSWTIEQAATPERSRVTVKFEPRGEDTEVVIIHEQVPDAATRAGHERGWVGCLDGLERLFE